MVKHPDPLNLNMPWWFPSRECGCPPEAYHRSGCFVTPIYAKLSAELGDPWRDMILPLTQELWWAHA